MFCPAILRVLTMLGQTALMLIRQALRSIPLVADDPKETCGVCSHQLHSIAIRLCQSMSCCRPNPSSDFKRDLSVAAFVYTLSYDLVIWGFPKMGVPPNHPYFNGMFHYKHYKHYKPSILILGCSTPIYGTPQSVIFCAGFGRSLRGLGLMPMLVTPDGFCVPCLILTVPS